MRAVTANVSGELIKEYSHWTNLYHLFIPSGETSVNFRFVCPHQKNIIFSGETYTAFNIKQGRVKTNNKSEVDRVSLTVANVSLAMSAYVEQYTLQGSRVDINKIYLDTNGQPPSNSNDFISIFSGYIDEIRYDEQSLEAVIVSKLHIPYGQFPRRTYQRGCNWIFKDTTTCMYSGERAACNKTTDDCIVRANIGRYGGFPFSVY